MKLTYLSAIAATLMLASCVSNQDKKDDNKEAETTQQQEAPQEPEKKEVVELTITANDQMQFDKKTLEVKAGSHVKLTLKNIGEMPKESMGHNWTLLENGVDLVQYATAAMNAKDNDYQPADRYADVITKTKLLGPGESETIEFDAPAAGTYKFLCTFPGHYGTMQGDFIVK